MASIFSKIVAGELPCYKIAETNDFLAFLDVFPLRKGHTLVIPKKEVDYIFDLDDETFAGLQLFSKIVAKAVHKAIPCKRIGTAVIGLEVPHAHIHLVPIEDVTDLDFSQEKMSFSKEEMETIAGSIRAQLES
ncbi:MAG: HIT family protein [Bacteroidia bacterium]|nr:HIT family protein [Bacteroidia bacterium]